MCTININIDERALRSIRPDLNSPTAIRQWAQDLINSHIKKITLDDSATLDLESAREMLLSTIRDEYAKP